MEESCSCKVVDDEMRMLEFLKKMPKIELHAHLNGSLSQSTISKLYKLNQNDCGNDRPTTVFSSPSGSLSECFRTFELIHNVTCTPEAISMATEDVIEEFYSDGVRYLELRSTPRQVPGKMTFSEYVEAILSSVKKCEQKFPTISVNLLLSINRGKPLSDAREIIEVVKTYSKSSKYIVGVDFSGDPTMGNVSDFIPLLKQIKKCGLKLSIHMAEIANQDEEVKQLLELEPDRIGHGTFIHPDKGGSESNFKRLLKMKKPLELCLTSNVLSKTTPTYKDHHFSLWKSLDYPLTLCTDDKGVFKTSLSEEYNLARKHFSLSPADLWDLSFKSIDYAFTSNTEKDRLRNHWLEAKESLFQTIEDITDGETNNG